MIGSKRKSKDKIFEVIEKIFISNFKRKKINNLISLQIYDLNEWDSLKNLRLLLEIEKKFKIKFSAEQIAQTTTVKKMIDLVNKKVN